MATSEMLEILTFIFVGFILIGIGVLLGTSIIRKNPINKLKVNTIYFQDELGLSYLLLRKSSEKAELKLYKINGANRTTMPKVFAVTDKDKDIYKIVSYAPTIIGGPSDEVSIMPDEVID